VTFKDIDSAQKIMLTDKPQTQKMLGRKVKNFDGSLWNRVCKDVVKKANLAKVTQSCIDCVGGGRGATGCVNPSKMQ